MTTTENPCAAVARPSTTRLLQEIAALAGIHARFAALEIKSVEHADLRGPCLATALSELAAVHGVTLQLPMHIDSRGEFRIVALNPDGTSPLYGSGPFGDFATVLNLYRPRTGIFAGATLLPESGWCYMNHFDVERMVTEQASALA
jgi:hypothetical protein